VGGIKTSISPYNFVAGGIKTSISPYNFVAGGIIK
jgi:hypothetical protein